MKRPLACSAALAALISLSSNSAAAQTEPEDLPPNAFPLSVDEALELALGNNLDLALANIRAEVLNFNARGAWGDFDWILDAEANLSDSEFEARDDPTSPLDDGTVFLSEQLNYAVDITRRLRTGGSFVLHWDSNRSESSTISPTFGLDTQPVQFTQTLRATLTQPLLRGAWNDYATASQREARLNYERQIWEERLARMMLLANVQNAYWELVAALEERNVAESSLELGSQQLEQNQRRLDAGVGTEVDVLQASTEVAMRTESLLRVTTDVQQRMDDLKLLLFNGEEEALWNLQLVPTTSLPESVEREELPDWTVALATALELRAERKQREIDVELARVRMNRAASDRLSALDFQLSASSRNVDTSFSSAFEDAGTYEFPSYTAGLTYNMPFENRTAANAHRAARAELRSAWLELDKQESVIVSDVRRTLRQAQYQAEAVRAADQSLALARRQLEAEEARFAEGLSTNFQVLEFQQQLIESMRTARRARVDYVKAFVDLENALGTLDVREEASADDSEEPNAVDQE